MRVRGLVVLLASCAVACGEVADGPAADASSRDDASEVGASLLLRGVLAPPQGSAAGCLFTNDPTQAEEVSGVLDVGVTNQYDAEFLARNTLQGSFETSRILIHGADVKIIDSTTARVLADYTTQGTGFVNPASGPNPGSAPVGFTIVNRATVAALAAQLLPFAAHEIVTYVTAFGVTTAGADVRSNTFAFQINACDGCLVQYTSVGSTPSCTGPAPTSTGASFCYLGEDVAFDCHLCLKKPICECGLTAPCPK